MDQWATAMTIDLALCQGGAKFLAATEFRHFYVGMTHLLQGVGIAAGAAKETLLFRKAPRLAIREEQWQGSSVEHFDNIDIRDKALQRPVLLLDPPHAVEGMGKAYQPILIFDSRYGLFSRDLAGHHLSQEHPHYLPDGSKDLLSHNHSEGSNFLHLHSASNSAVVCYGNTADPDLDAAIDNAFQGYRAIKRVLSMNV